MSASPSRGHTPAAPPPRGARAGIVYLDRIPCGRIEETPEGGTRFTYSTAYLARADARALSLTLPLRREPFEHPRGLMPFFENLLPEGWLLEIALKKLQLDASDHFGLLLGTAADCSGWARVLREGDDGGEDAA